MARGKRTEEKLVTTTYTLTPELKQEVEDMAWKRRISASELIREVLTDHLDDHADEPEAIGVA